VEAYIKAHDVHVGYAPESHPDSWRAGRQVFYGDHYEIHIWPFAYRLYGWDMMTSVLIHEFGHVELLKTEGLSQGLEAEKKANEYGERIVPSELIPPQYLEYRKFFLRSYETSGNWTQEQCLDELKSWRKLHIGTTAVGS
jgi:hypothetical protein